MGAGQGSTARPSICGPQWDNVEPLPKAAARCQNSKSDFYKNLVEKKSATLSVATHYGTSAPLQSQS